MNKECETCIRNKTMYCPNSNECMTTDDKPYYQNKIMLLEENKQLKLINKEYERLNKENGKGFKITNVQEYNIDELLSYKKYRNNWIDLREILKIKYYNGEKSEIKDILGKMQELEQGSDE